MVTSLFPPESELGTVRASTTRSPNAQTAGQCICKSFIFNTVWLTKCDFDNLAGFTCALGPDERPRAGKAWRMGANPPRRISHCIHLIFLLSTLSANHRLASSQHGISPDRLIVGPLPRQTFVPFSAAAGAIRLQVASGQRGSATNRLGEHGGMGFGPMRHKCKRSPRAA